MVKGHFDLDIWIPKQLLEQSDSQIDRFAVASMHRPYSLPHHPSGVIVVEDIVDPIEAIGESSDSQTYKVR